MKALIVEDDANLGFLWQEALSESGFTPVLVSSCADATEQLLEEDFQVCLLDLMVADGITTTLADWIKIRSPRTFVIGITGSEYGQRGELSLNHGYDLTFRKPIPVQDLSAIAEYAAFAA